MKRILTLTLVLVPVVTAHAVVAAQDKAQLDRGMQVYMEQKCALCHSIAGKGNTKGPLDRVVGQLKAEEIREWIVNPAEMAKQTKAERKPPMKAFANLPKADLDALVAYITSVKK